MKSARFLVKKLWLSGTIVLLSLGCQKEAQLPEVDFSFPDGLEAPVDIQFENNTLFADSYMWDLGEGTFTKVKEPLNTYYIPGKYEVTLKASNSEGSSKLTKTISIYGITFYVFNASSVTIPNLFAFTDDPEIQVFYELGSVTSNSKSAYCYTEALSIQLGCVLYDETILFFDLPFRLTKNQHNELLIHDYTPVYEVTLKSGDYWPLNKVSSVLRETPASVLTSWISIPE